MHVLARFCYVWTILNSVKKQRINSKNIHILLVNYQVNI